MRADHRGDHFGDPCGMGQTPLISQGHVGLFGGVELEVWLSGVKM